MFAGKFVKSESFLAVLRLDFIFNVKRVEVSLNELGFLSETVL